jgi:hypothetical protein
LLDNIPHSIHYLSMHNATAIAVSSKRSIKLSATIKVTDQSPTFEGVYPDMATALMVLAPYWPSR